MKKLDLQRFAKLLAVPGVLSILLLGLLIPATAFAAPVTSPKCGTNLQCVITFGDQAIASRQTALNTLTTKITTDLNDHKITSGQASPLQADVATNRSGLTSLKTTLDAEKTIVAARANVLSIYTQFRIYAVVLPRDYRTLEYNIEANVQAKMQAASPEIQAAIPSAPASKKVQLNALFSDYQTQVANAATEISPLPNDFTQMTPTSFNLTRPSYQATRLSVDKAEHTANLDLQKAAKDLRQMVKLLGL
jgi:hypothetical protein